ncbi:hypothetical protein PIB30_054773 [Stylosanthes scabra]|uniref:Uncharacterized protein n=1 Tax=Stylosanthes scabra TaxID=79078 RepID=A0ABU6ZHL8_9FABA|nr:hypothetical protein [Stylosanthes scabra]
MRLKTLGLAVEPPPRANVFMEVEKSECSTTSSSSIGRNNDDDEVVSSERSMENNTNENEAQSSFNNNQPLHAMETLEQVLPMRRGISKYYNGKSKSFTSLGDAASTPLIKDIAKPDNAYTRRRRNLMAFNHVWDNKNRNSLLRSNSGGIYKRTTLSTSRGSLALAVAMNNSESSSSMTSSEDSTTSSLNLSPQLLLPPLHPHSNKASPTSPLQSNFSTWRSFSMADLHHCAIAATVKIQSPSLGDETAHPS